MADDRRQTRGTGLVRVLRWLSESMLATVAVAAVVTALAIMYVSMHAGLTQCEYHYTRLKEQETELLEAQRRLSVRLAEATAPDRIRAAAARDGLVQYPATKLVYITVEPKPKPPEQGRPLTRSDPLVAAWGRLRNGL